MRLAENVSTVHTDFNTDELVQSTSGYVGSERVDEDLKALRLVHSLDDLVGPDSEWNFTVVPANLEQPTITLFTDANERVFVTRVPPPAGDDSFPKAAEDAAAILENYRPLFFNPAKPFRQHRRGDFPVIAVGLSFGGGQQEPKRIYQNDKDLQLLNNICGMACFKRLACHASSAFQTWAPKLYQLYAGYMDRLQKLFPDRYLNFSRSVFACCTLNFGPRTTTIEHLDHLNYIYGWCAITALGSFDFRSGGHLVLWDLEMVIEVPPGWTMLIPSSYLRHSNTAIAPEETRYSLTQYTAGGLFRVIDDEGHVRKHMSQAEKSAAEELQRERINMDLNCYSTLMELGITPAE
ncbi:hypothetical protein FB446DRAFT_761512 [Lentinula raphanica]|nr:hypothetical protein FB446DRAFT_761512 [Lentinula raphanica]